MVSLLIFLLSVFANISFAFETPSSLRRPFIGNEHFQCKDHSHSTKLNSLLLKITRGNPEVFSGPYQLKRICLELDKSRELIAKATASERKIRFSKGLVQKLTVSEFAFIFCHELAHITMQHIEWREVHPDLEQDSEWKIQKTKVDFAHSRMDVHNFAFRYAEQDILRKSLEASLQGNDLLARAMESFADSGDLIGYLKTLVELGENCCFERSQKLKGNLVWQMEQDDLRVAWMVEQEILYEIEDNWYGEENARFNWREQEADEVGVALCVSAGFKRLDFAKSIMKTKTSENPTMEKCWDEWEQFEAGVRLEPLVTPRGRKAHPHPCHRIWNVLL